ncbi:MAG: glycosyltransferase family 2 protein [Candidatus Aenigmatarchaeota archaeon]
MTSNDKKSIYIPVYNGEEFLNDMLQRIDELGYLDEIKMIDDCSTDSTEQILEEWSDKGLDFVTMKDNGQKIGSIKNVLEEDFESERLPEYIVLHDADCFIHTESENDSSKNHDLKKALDKSIDFMKMMNWQGMALKDVPFIDNNSNFLERIQYREYRWDRSFHYRIGKVGKMRCIPGAGGIYKSDSLLDVLKKHSLRHDGDDMETTALMQKFGYNVGYYTKRMMKDFHLEEEDYPLITVNTITPKGPLSLFNQRCRWTAGAIDTYLKEGKFYLGELKQKPRRLGFQALYETGKMVTYPLWYWAVFEHPEYVLPISWLMTGAMNTALTWFNPEYHDEFETLPEKIWDSTKNFIPNATYTILMDSLRVPGGYFRAFNNYLKRKWDKEKNHKS